MLHLTKSQVSRISFLTSRIYELEAAKDAASGGTHFFDLREFNVQVAVPSGELRAEIDRQLKEALDALENLGVVLTFEALQVAHVAKPRVYLGGVSASEHLRAGTLEIAKGAGDQSLVITRPAWWSGDGEKVR